VRGVTLLVTAKTLGSKDKSDRSSTRRERSTGVASTAVKWDTFRRTVPSRRETRLVTTVDRTGTLHAIVPVLASRYQVQVLNEYVLAFGFLSVVFFYVKHSISGLNLSRWSDHH
jgi:hypothetical protein